MERLAKPNRTPNPSENSARTSSLLPWLASLAIVFVVGTGCLQTLAAGQIMPEPAASDPSLRHPPQQDLTVQDRTNQWFFSKAVATSIWELAMYAEQLTLRSHAERVETLHEVYTELMDIEGELALKRQAMADQYAITEALMSHPAVALTPEQTHAFDTYMLDVIALHQTAATVVDKDAWLKTYYEHLLALNGITVFLERFQDFLRSNLSTRERSVWLVVSHKHPYGST